VAKAKRTHYLRSERSRDFSSFQLLPLHQAKEGVGLDLPLPNTWLTPESSVGVLRQELQERDSQMGISHVMILYQTH